MGKNKIATDTLGKKQESVDFIDNWLRYYFVARGLGLCPYRIEGKEKGKRRFVPSKLGTIYGHMFALVYMLSVYIFYDPNIHSHVSHQDAVDQFMLALMLPVSPSLTVTFIYFACYFQRDLCNIFSDQNQIDHVIKNLFGKTIKDNFFDGWKNLEFNLFGICGVVCMCIDYVALPEENKLNGMLTLFFLFDVPIWLLHFTRFQFTWIVNMIGLRLHAIVMVFRELREDISKKHIDIKEIIYNVKMGCEIHCNLVNLLNRTNYIYSFQLLMIIFENALVIVTWSYAAYKSLRYPFLIFEFVTIVMYIMFGLSGIFSTSMICKHALNAGEQVGIELHKLQNELNDPELLKYVMIYSLQMIQHKIKLTAFGVFVMDMTLFLNMNGIILTFIIIVVQTE